MNFNSSFYFFTTFLSLITFLIPEEKKVSVYKKFLRETNEIDKRKKV